MHAVIDYVHSYDAFVIYLASADQTVQVFVFTYLSHILLGRLCVGYTLYHHPTVVTLLCYSPSFSQTSSDSVCSVESLRLCLKEGSDLSSMSSLFLYPKREKLLLVTLIANMAF